MSSNPILVNFQREWTSSAKIEDDYLAIAWNVDGSWLGVCDCGDRLHCYLLEERRTGKCELELATSFETPAMPTAICAGADPDYFFVGDSDGQLYQWFPESEEVNVIATVDGSIAGIAFLEHPDAGPLLVYTGSGETVGYWSLQDEKLLAEVELPWEGHCLDIFEEYLIVGTGQAAALINLESPEEFAATWELELGRTERSTCYTAGVCVTAEKESMVAVGGGVSGKMMLLSGPDDDPKPYYAHRISRSPDRPAAANCCVRIPYLSDEDSFGCFATGGSDGFVRLWFAGHESRQHELNLGGSSYAGTRAAVTCMSTHPDGELVALTTGTDPTDLMSEKRCTASRNKLILLRVKEVSRR